MTDLSIVVPARNEAKRLPASAARLEAYMDAHPGVELVIAADQDSDDDTVRIAQALTDRDRRIRVVPVHSTGKGYAVHAGVESASAPVVLTADTDLAVDPGEFDTIVAVARTGAIGIASRSVAGARRIGEPLPRFVIGRAFNAVSRALVLPGIRDSQCGFKAFPRDVGLELLRAMRSRGWVFDVEFLAMARLRGIDVHEMPVTWRYGHESTVRPLRDAGSVLRELWDVYRRLGRVRAPR